MRSLSFLRSMALTFQVSTESHARANSLVIWFKSVSVVISLTNWLMHRIHLGIRMRRDSQCPASWTATRPLDMAKLEYLPGQSISWNQMLFACTQSVQIHNFTTIVNLSKRN